MSSIILYNTYFSSDISSGMLKNFSIKDFINSIHSFPVLLSCKEFKKENRDSITLINLFN